MLFKKIKKLWLELIFPGLIGLIILLWFVFFPLKDTFDWTDIFFEGLYFSVTLGSFFIVRKTKINVLLLGWAVFIYGLLIDLLDEFTSEPILFDTKIEGLLTALGLLLIGIGLYKGVKNLQQEIDQRRKTETMLRQSEDKYRLLAEKTKDIIFTQDMDLNLTYISPSAERLSGYSRDEIFRLGIKGCMTFDSYRKAMETFDNYSSIASQQNDVEIPLMEYEYVCKNGSTFWGEIHLDFLRDDQGHPMGLHGVLRDVTERKQARDALKESEREKKMILESTSEIIVFQDKRYKIIWANKAAGDSVGLKAEELTDRYCYEIWGKRSCPCDNCPVKKTRISNKAQEEEIKGPDGLIWEVRSAPVYDQNNSLLGFVQTALDISDKKQAEIELKLEKDYMENIFDNSADALVIVDKHGNFFRRNKKAIEMFGPDQGENRKVFDVYASRREMDNLLQKLRKYGQITDYEARLKRRNGSTFPAALSISLLYDDNGQKSGSVSVIRDLTEKKEFERRLIELSYHDRLTGLYNRTFFEEEMHRYGSDRFLPLGLIICDVDGLKIINDNLGHQQGDQLLKIAANILKTCFRESDIISRIGGDEFAVLLPKSEFKVVKDSCLRVRQALAKYNSNPRGWPLNMSIGYAVSENNPFNIQFLFKQADDNMYLDKRKNTKSSYNLINQAIKADTFN